MKYFFLKYLNFCWNSFLKIQSFKLHELKIQSFKLHELKKARVRGPEKGKVWPFFHLVSQFPIAAWEASNFLVFYLIHVAYRCFVSPIQTAFYGSVSLVRSPGTSLSILSLKCWLFTSCQGLFGNIWHGHY